MANNNVKKILEDKKTERESKLKDLKPGRQPGGGWIIRVQLDEDGNGRSDGRHGGDYDGNGMYF